MQNLQNDILSHIFSYTEIETKDLASVSKKWDAATKRSMAYLFSSYERSDSLKPYTELAKQQIQTIGQSRDHYLEIQSIKFVFQEIMRRAQARGYQKEPVNMQTLSSAHLEVVLKWVYAQNSYHFASRVLHMKDFFDSFSIEFISRLNSIEYLPLLKRAKEIAIEMEKRKTKLEQIKVLNLNGLNLYALPKEIKYFSGLQELNLSRNSLKTFPKEISSLTSLQKLNLSENSLTTLPEEIGSLTQLKQLDLSKNSLTTLPKEIGSLTSLQELNLSENSLTTLLEKIGSLTQLKQLDLSYNQLKTLPKEIGSLTSLQKLNLYQNNQIALPLIAKSFFVLNVFLSTIENFENFFKYKN